MNGCTHESNSIYCGKIPAPDSAFCPKHLLIAQGAQAELEKRMEKLRARKAYKKALRESLAGSPLAAVNPKFEVQSGAYGR